MSYNLCISFLNILVSNKFIFFRFHSIPFNSIQFRSIPFNFNSIQFHSIPFNSVQFHSIPFNSIQFHSIPFNSIQCHSIPFIFMLRHSVSLFSRPYRPNWTLNISCFTTKETTPTQSVKWSTPRGMPEMHSVEVPIQRWDMISHESVWSMSSRSSWYHMSPDDRCLLDHHDITRVRMIDVFSIIMISHESRWSMYSRSSWYHMSPDDRCILDHHDITRVWMIDVFSIIIAFVSHSSSHGHPRLCVYQHHVLFSGRGDGQTTRGNIDHGHISQRHDGNYIKQVLILEEL